MKFTRTEFDKDAYVKRVQQNPCFICAMVAETSDSDHEIIQRDDQHIAFFSRYPSLLGYALVSPAWHAEDIVEDLTERQYLDMQALVHRVARALKRCLPTERMYVLSLGSQQGNSHIHWHIAPLPPGVPYEQQQFHALMPETGGVLDIEPADLADLAQRVRAELAA
ncbi:MAG: HIT family protein, partial [Stackebrandtia sp.]